MLDDMHVGVGNTMVVECSHSRMKKLLLVAVELVRVVRKHCIPGHRCSVGKERLMPYRQDAKSYNVHERPVLHSELPGRAAVF